MYEVKQNIHIRYNQIRNHTYQYRNHTSHTIMAAKVRVTNVAVLNNPCKFLEPFQFQITFECLELEHDLEWKLLYVGSAENHDHDQILDTVLVGGIKAGTSLIG